MSIRKKRMRCTKMVFGALLITTVLTGCSAESFIYGRDESGDGAAAAGDGTETKVQQEGAPQKILNHKGSISVQTGSTVIDPGSDNFTEQLETGSFYVVHDGYYYPAFSYASNYDFSDTMKDYVDPYENRQMYFTEDNETEIPTLFLGAGDKLVYYDTENVLDYVKWERYQDLGYTVGLYNIHQTEYSKTAYLDLEEEEGCIISGSELESINAEMTAPMVSLIRIGNVDITDELVSDGLISGAKAGESYDLEVYDGTTYRHYIATADMHAFKAFEMFASVETKPLQQSVWEVKIPEYFVDGYYKVNAVCTAADMFDGMVRIVRGDSYYNDAEAFNEPMLYPYTEQQLAEGGYNGDEYLYQYSECDALNKFTTQVVGAVGYDDGTEKKDEADKTEALRSANISRFDIRFPEDEVCSITIIPSEKEPGGDAYLLVGDKSSPLAYSAFDNTYNLTLHGDGDIYTLYVSGFWNSYNIRLGNCTQDFSGNSQSVKTEDFTDGYSLDSYVEEQKPDKGKELLDSVAGQGQRDDAGQENTETVPESTEEATEGE